MHQSLNNSFPSDDLAFALTPLDFMSRAIHATQGSELNRSHKSPYEEAKRTPGNPPKGKILSKSEVKKALDAEQAVKREIKELKTMKKKPQKRVPTPSSNL